MKARSSRIFVLLLLFVVGAFFWVRNIEDFPEKTPGEAIENLESPPLVSQSPLSDESEESLIEMPLEKTASSRGNDVNSKVLGRGPAATVIARFSVRELEEIELDLEDTVHTHKIKEWKGRLSPGADELEALFDGVGSEKTFILLLPDSTELKIGDLRTSSFGLSRGAVAGKLESDLGGDFVLSYVNQALAGSIRDFGRGMTWEIRNAGNGFQYIAQVDTDALGECGVCAIHENDR